MIRERALSPNTTQTQVDLGGGTAPSEKIDSTRAGAFPMRARSKKPEPPPDGFRPFGNAPEATRRRYRGILARCHTSRASAIRAFCVECNGYSPQMAATCETRTCPLWAFNRRIFRGRGNGAS